MLPHGIMPTIAESNSRSLAGRGGSRLIVSTAKKRHGTVYCYRPLAAATEKRVRLPANRGRLESEQDRPFEMLLDPRPEPPL